MPVTRSSSRVETRVNPYPTPQILVHSVNQRHKQAQGPSVTDIPYWTNPRVIEALQYFISLNASFKGLLIEYRGDTDADDWREFMKLIKDQTGETPLHYSTMSWLLYLNLKLERGFLSKLPSRKSTIILYPHIFRQTKENWIDQLEKDVDLMDLLNGYPKSEGDDIFVYR